MLDLIFGAAPRRQPGFSQRRENRARLKRMLLNELWGETVTDQEDYAHITLRVDEEVLARLEERLILLSDLQQVIAHAERTGSWLLNPQTQHHLAHYRPAEVTYC